MKRALVCFSVILGGLSGVIAQTPDLATGSATAIAASDGKLYVGSPRGEVNVYDSASAKALETIHGTAAPVSLVSASPAGVAWVSGGQPAGILDRAGIVSAPSEQTLYVRPAGSAEATVIVLRPAGVNAPVRALSWIGSRLAIIEDFDTTFFDAKAKAIVLPDSFMPPDVAKELHGSRLWAQTAPDGAAVVVMAKPYAMRRNPLSTGSPYVSLFTAFRVKDRAWTKLGGFASSAFDITPPDTVTPDPQGKIPPGTKFQVVSDTVAVDERGFVGLEGTSLLSIPVTVPGWESSRQPIAVRWSDGELPPDALWFGLSPGSAWWWDGNALVQQERKGGRSAAYLQWNEPDAALRAFAVEGEGLWVATTAGVRRIDPSHPDSVLGFGGFVRVPLGKDAGKATTAEERAIEQGIWKWRLASADEAGRDGGTMIAAVFGALGVTLPKDAASIGTTKTGAVVHDELRFGDVLAFRRGAAIYIGDGKTVELQKGYIRNGTLWFRPRSIVRRFIVGSGKETQAKGQGARPSEGLKTQNPESKS